MDVGSYVAFAGGVGGAKMVQGMSGVLRDEQLKVVVNTADDFEHLGLYICPDLDTIMYTLCNLHNVKTGWGLDNETWNFMQSLSNLGGTTWFSLGDHDLATHVERTNRLNLGDTLTEITADLASKLGTSICIIPMSNDPVRTVVHTKDGPIAFQDYFVRLACEPVINRICFEGIEKALFNPLATNELNSNSLKAVIICPSNPYVSINPILSLKSVRETLSRVKVPIIAVSPIIKGRAIKGPAAKMMNELGYEPSSSVVAKEYCDIIDGFVIDNTDIDVVDCIQEMGISVLVTNTIMNSIEDKKQLAQDVIEFAGDMMIKGV
ncbi:MAG TPA: 2-phospho-L-lactate transferase [Chloroflexi bacterium]|nr:2-phospho-L-lactate transferase [Chloroflexota bacterium]HCU98215.1 2-phospho-L-lactate transferase [Chloroflexota bacterium]|tara:strand:+ start:2114 stop:3076 length:963 start_codon:yes stop_codon:yes gene_type:complete